MDDSEGLSLGQDKDGWVEESEVGEAQSEVQWDGDGVQARMKEFISAGESERGEPTVDWSQADGIIEFRG